MCRRVADNTTQHDIQRGLRSWLQSTRVSWAGSMSLGYCIERHAQIHRHRFVFSSSGVTVSVLQERCFPVS
jgi:hypothetical protein